MLCTRYSTNPGHLSGTSHLAMLHTLPTFSIEAMPQHHACSRCEQAPPGNCQACSSAQQGGGTAKQRQQAAANNCFLLIRYNWLPEVFRLLRPMLLYVVFQRDLHERVVLRTSCV